MIHPSNLRRRAVASAPPSRKFVIAAGSKGREERSRARSGLTVAGGWPLGSRGSGMAAAAARALAVVIVDNLYCVWYVSSYILQYIGR